MRTPPATDADTTFRTRRTQLGLSIPDLAPLLCLKEQTIRNIECGGKRPGRQTLLLLWLLRDPHAQSLIQRYHTEEP